MVFLHGYLSSKEAFAAQIRYFSRFYRVTAIDFIGFGGSVPLRQAFSVDDYAAWTREVFRLLNVKSPHVIAHSFGCRVLIKMAKRGSAEYRGLSSVMKESYKKIVNEDLRDEARKIDNEVMLVQGTQDTTTPKREAEAYLACLKHGQLTMMEGGHFAFAERPLEFNMIAEEFFYG